MRLTIFLCQEYNLTNVITKPPCFKADPPKFIDIMLLSDDKVCKSSMVSPCPLSDFHHFIICVLNIDLPRTTTRKIYYRFYKNFDPTEFGNNLRQAPFLTGQVLDIDTHIWYFQKHFTTIHAPIKTRIIKTNREPHQ